MKKRYILLSGVIVILLLSVLFVYRYLNSQSSFKSIYLVPGSAAMIIESDNPVDTWEKIIHSDAWNHLSKIPSIEKFNLDILNVDSLINSNRLLVGLFGNRKVMASVHLTNAGGIQFLYIIDIGRASRLNNIESITGKILGENFNLTKRVYNNSVIYELHDRSSNEMYYFTLIREKFVLSLRHTLIEASIDEVSKMTIGRDLKYINVSKHISGKGLFSFYIQCKYLPGFLKTMGINPGIGEKIRDKIAFAGFYFDISEDGLITVEGISSLSDSAPDEYLELFYAGDTEIKSAEVIPQRVASLVKLNFDHAVDYFDRSLKSSAEEDYQTYLNNLAKTERKLDISLEKNFLDWMDQEIILLQTKPSNLGRDNEFTAILKAKNNKAPSENLEYLKKQIKRNYPVKIKEVDYQGYKINYLSVPGILKALFGKMLEKIEKPYYTIIDDHVIFSNHPQTLKNLVDDHISGNTLDKSVDFYNFAKKFGNESSVYSYVDLPVLFPNLKSFVDSRTWDKLSKSKQYITCFSNAGLQTNREDDLIHLLFKAQYKRDVEDFEIMHYTDWLNIASVFPEEDHLIKKDTLLESKIIISDLDASKQTEYFPNGKEKYTVNLKNGIKQGVYREYYDNGNLKIRGKFRNDKKEGIWKYYDYQGRLIKEQMFEGGKLVEE